jgi:hypothetical protein
MSSEARTRVVGVRVHAMSRATRGVAALLCAIGLSGAAIVPPSAAGLVARQSSDDPGVDEVHFFGTPQGEGPRRLKVCEFVQRVDWAHISSTSVYRAVQSHGNWGNVNCDYKSAVVTTMVMKKNATGVFVNVGDAGKKTLRPASSLTSSARVTAHYRCKATGDHVFKSWTDVDIVGIDDAPNKQYSPPRTLKCS